MRLYLSSYGFGEHPEKLASLVGENKLAAVIANAGDLDEVYRPIGLEKQVTGLANLGFNAKEIDLRKYFGRPDELSKALEGIGLLWVRGGNVFVLQRAMEQSGFNKVLPELLKKDAFVYGGYSAGIVVLTPTLKGIELIDDPVALPAGYEPDFSWSGMGIVPYSIAPHFESDHPESGRINDAVRYFQDNGMPFKTLRDGEVIIVENERA